jgi:hypothetical protein
MMNYKNILFFSFHSVIYDGSLSGKDEDSLHQGRLRNTIKVLLFIRP